MTSEPFSRTPFRAPFPIPATFDTGTPITKAPGQPNTRTVIASSTFCEMTHVMNAPIKTAGVYHFEKLSIKRSASDLESCASSTNSIIFPNVVSSPTRSALI